MSGDGRFGRRRRRALVAVVVAGALVAPVASGAQPAPSVTAPTGKLQPGDPVEVVVRDCPEPPEVTVLAQFQDALAPPSTPFTVDPDGTTWTWAFPYPAPPPGGVAADRQLSIRCGGALLEVYLDVDAPQVVLGPVPGPAPGYGVVEGTDCAPGPVELVITGSGPPTTVVVAPGEHGNWHHDLGTFAEDLTIEATCGDIDYGRLVAPGSGAPPPPPSGPPPPPGPATPPAVAAEARPAAPTFTG